MEKAHTTTKTSGGSLKEYKVSEDKDKHSVAKADNFQERKLKEKVKNDINVTQQGYSQTKELFVKEPKVQSPDDTAFIVHTLQSHFVFYKLKAKEQNALAQKFFYAHQKAGECVIKQGDDAQYFFIIDKGAVDIQVNGASKRELKRGEGFGELALMYNSPRSATCKTKEESFFWCLDRQTFKQVIQTMVSEEYEQNRLFIEKTAFFQNLTAIQVDGIAGLLIEQKFQKDQWIVNENDVAESFYVIKTGLVSVCNSQGVEVKTLTAGNSFGENALLSDKATRTMTIKAKEETICLALARDTLNSLLGNKVEQIINRNISRWTLEKIAWGKFLEPSQIDQLLDGIEVETKTAGQVILPKLQTLAHQLVMVLDGNLGYKKDQKVLAAKYGSIGGDDVYDLSSNKISDDIVVLGEKCVVGVIKIREITKAIGGAIKDVTEQNKKKRSAKQEIEQSVEKAMKSINYKELVCLKHLGAGQFGSVFLVKNPHEDSLYALKCISKKQVCDSHLEKYVVGEKQVMECCNFPFIMRYFRCFQDDYYVFFLLEYIQGMELFDVIREIGLLSSYDAQFYSACALLAIEYLHKNHIVYRDIKPENIMVDYLGYAKLVDMGTAHQFTKGHKTTTIIGTPHYMAPEILAGKGHSYYVDLWSLGVMLYEFLAGGVPFGEDADDPYEIYEAITHNKITYPSFFKDNNAKQLVEQLLSQTPEMRLSGGSYSKLRKHPFYNTFDWGKLLELQIKTPWQPSKDKILTPEAIHQLEKKGNKLPVELKAHYTGAVPTSKKVPDWDRGVFDY